MENPAEQFEDLRDRNDLKMLLNHERFMREALGDDGSASPAHHPPSPPLMTNGNGHNGHGGGGKVARSRTTHHERSVPYGSNGHRNGEKRRRTLRKLTPPVDRKWMEQWRVDLKIAQVRA